MYSRKENGEGNELGNTLAGAEIVRDQILSKAKSRTKTTANTAFIIWDGHGRKIPI